MREKIKSSIMVCLLIISILLAGMNFGIVATDTDITKDSSARSSRLGGQDYHWDSIGILSEPKVGQDINTIASRDPKVAVEGNKVYLVWEDGNDTNGAGNDYDIFYRYFDGNIWSDVQIISEPVEGGNKNVGQSYDPAITVENGNIYVTWEDANLTNSAGNDYDIHYRCNLSGSGWEDIQVISESVFGSDTNTGQSINPEIAVNNGKIYVIWEDANDTNGADTDYDIFFICNLTGSNWEDVQVISEPVVGTDENIENSNDPDIAVENDKIYVVWHDLNDTYGAGNSDLDIFYRCNLSGSSWEEVQVLSEPVKGSDTNTGSSRNPEIAVENSKIYVVWEENNNTNSAGTDDDVFFRCNLTGSNWEELQIISEPIEGSNTNTGQSERPTLSVENDKIYVVWRDRNDTNGAGTEYDVFYKCNLTGSSWEAVQVISEPVEGSDTNTGVSDYPHIGVENGKTYIFWHDRNDTYGSGTDYDIFHRITFHAPVLSSGGVTPTVGNTSSNFHFTVTYLDADNDAPTVMNVSISGTNYTMLQSAPGDQDFFDGKSYYFDINLLTLKTYNHKFWTSDGIYNSFTSITNEPMVQNTMPNITTSNIETATEDTYYEVDYEYEDIDIANIGQVGTWSIQTNAGWLDFNTTTGILNGTPTNDDVGDYNINITIDDGIDINWTNFQLTVEQVNDPPILLTDALANATEDQYYEVTFDADDIDTQLLFWKIKTNASWLMLNNTIGTINGTPSNDDVGGEFWVDVTIGDGEYIDTHNFSLEVENVNDPPTIITDDVLTAEIDELYEVDYEAADIDPTGDTLTWSLNTNASWLSINSSTGVLSGTPTTNDTGTYWVNVSVSDGNGESDWRNFTITVPKAPITPPPPPTNKNPVITTDDVLIADVDKLYSVDYEATDEDTPLINLTWSLTTNASWLNINSSTGVLSGTPGAGDVGTYNVNVSVSDGTGGLAFTNFIVTVKKPVTPPPENNKPKLTSGKMSPSKGDSDTEFTFTVTYTDADNDTGEVYIWIDGIKYKMTIDPENIDFTDGVDYTYKTKLDEGDHDYYFTATDGTDAAEAGDTTPTTTETAKSTPKIEKVGEKEETDNMMLYLIIIIIIIIIIALLAVAMRKKKPAEEEAEEEEALEDEEVAEELECLECGAMVPGAEGECPECGAELPEAESEEEPKEDLEGDEELDEEELEKEPGEETLEEEALEDEELDEEFEEDEEIEE